jgi:DNA-binding transcriptional ArsR family regulator
MNRYAGADQQRLTAPIDPEAVAEVQATAPSEALLTVVVETFQALADTTRAKILYALIRRPLCVRDLALVAGVSESAVSHQLRILRARRIVKPRRAGNVIYYSVDDGHVAVLFREAEYHADHVQQGLPEHPYL